MVGSGPWEWTVLASGMLAVRGRLARLEKVDNAAGRSSHIFDHTIALLSVRDASNPVTTAIPNADAHPPPNPWKLASGRTDLAS